MKVKQLIKKLSEYNMNADVKVVAHYKDYDYTISFVHDYCVRKNNTKQVDIFVDDLCIKADEHIIRKVYIN